MARRDPTDYDKLCMETTDGNINMLVPWYLMAAYAYYVEDDPILSDMLFDRMGKKLLTHYDEVEHMHKDLISKSDLDAGTFLGKYPSRIKGAVAALRGKDG
jgi:NAD-dependent DNA ligase